MRKALGVDIGNVIIDHRKTANGSVPFFLTDDYLEAPPVDGAFETLRELSDIFKQSIHLVSKCDVITRDKNLTWLGHKQFYRHTATFRENVHFCNERRQKAEICEKLGITHFIDDKLEVLSSMIGKVGNLYLFRPEESEKQKFSQYLTDVRTAQTWEEVLKKIKNCCSL